MVFRIAARYENCVDVDYLKQHGIEFEKIDFNIDSEEAVIKAISAYDAFVVVDEPITRFVCEKVKTTTKYMCRNGIGYDTIDTVACAENGICVSNTAGSMDQAVAESALLLMLEASRKYYYSDREMRQGIWNRSVWGNELEGKTVGFVGFGLIAQRVAQYLQGFQCRIIVYDQYCNPEKLEQYQATTVSSLEELAKNADIVTVHCPLNDETRGMLSDSFFEHMKKTAYFVNTARGAIVDEDALIRALEKQSIAGAGLDVYEIEPLSVDSPLRRMDNVCLAAHIASFTEESMARTRRIAAENIVDYVENRVPRNCLNRDYVKYVSI